MSYKGYLYLTSFNYETITYVISLITKIKTFSFTFKTGGSASMPIRKKIFTLIQSPHVYKKSQESFQLFSFKQLLLVNLTSIYSLYNFFKYLKTSFFYNLELKTSLYGRYIF